MKVIDLLNKIANGEEVPKRIKYINSIWEYDENTKDYINDDIWLIYSMNSIGLTEREVEIIEEKKAHTLNDIRESYGLPRIEEKKIPKKINNGYTKQSIEDMKEARFNSNDMEKICNRIGWLMENRNELSNKIDEIIDYLKNKGE